MPPLFVKSSHADNLVTCREKLNLATQWLSQQPIPGAQKKKLKSHNKRKFNG